MWKFHFFERKPHCSCWCDFPDRNRAASVEGGAEWAFRQASPTSCHSLRLKGFCHPLLSLLQPAEVEDWSAFSLRSNEKREYVLFSGPSGLSREFTAAWPPPYAHDYCSRWPQLLRRRNQDRGAGAQRSTGPLAKFRFPSLGGWEDRVSLVLAAPITHRVRFCSGASSSRCFKIKPKNRWWL